MTSYRFTTPAGGVIRRAPHYRRIVTPQVWHSAMAALIGVWEAANKRWGWPAMSPHARFQLELYAAHILAIIEAEPARAWRLLVEQSTDLEIAFVSLFDPRRFHHLPRNRRRW